MLTVIKAFEKFEKDDGVELRFPKLVFVALQLLSVGLALYKCSTMGLLPVTSADWTSLIPERWFMEAGLVPVKM
jgi:ER membrane protein complex subunit 4